MGRVFVTVIDVDLCIELLNTGCVEGKQVTTLDNRLLPAVAQLLKSTTGFRCTEPLLLLDFDLVKSRLDPIDVDKLGDVFPLSSKFSVVLLVQPREDCVVEVSTDVYEGLSDELVGTLSKREVSYVSTRLVEKRGDREVAFVPQLKLADCRQFMVLNQEFDLDDLEFCEVSELTVPLLRSFD